MASESLIKQLKQSFYNPNGTPNERLSEYCSQEVHKIVIDGNTFTGYKTYSFFWEKTYVKEPERSASGVINNLNSYATFITPHLQIKFSLMSMEDYRRIYGLIMSKNEFIVTCYNPITNETTTNRMYFYPDSLPKLNMMARNIFRPNGQKEKWIELLGVQDYTIEMVGTNVETEKIEILYRDKNGNLLGSKTVEVNTEFLVGEGISVPSIDGYNFDGKWQRVGGTQEFVPNNTAMFASLWNTIPNELASNSITFQAQYTSSKEFVLSLAWGVGIPYQDNYGNNITAIKFQPSSSETVSTALSRNDITLLTGDKFTSLLLSPNPQQEENGQVYITHENKGWRFSPSLSSNKVENDTVLNFESDIIIYQVFEPVKNSISFDSNGGTHFNTIYGVEFGSSVALPIPYKEDKVFKGWYKDKDFNKQFISGNTMPPYGITLYAKWE